MMVKEFACQKNEVSCREEEYKELEEMKHWREMESPELSLGPSSFLDHKSEGRNPLLSAEDFRRKRKFPWDHLISEPMVESGFELQLKDPLPIDWEQCLDLESGRMYYMNRNTFKKSCCCPKDQKLDLDLNISSLSSNSNGNSPKLLEDQRKHTNSSANMVAVACLNCHLLVMLHKSSPSCPNCKYLHSFPIRQGPHRNTTAARRSLRTLRLLN